MNAVTQMTSDNSETISLLRDSVSGTVPFDGKRIRSLRGAEPDFDRTLWRAMGEQGWLSILVPEEQGGLGLGMAAAAAVAERLGAACAPEPYVMAGLLTPYLLSQSSNQAQKQGLMPAVLSGDHLVSLAWQPAGGSLDPEQADVTARMQGGDVVLSGQCRFVTPALADAYLVLAKGADGPLLALVEAKALAAGRTLEPGPDGVASARLSLSEVKVPADAVLLSGAAASTALRQALDFAVIAQCAELCGLMQRSLEMTLEYLKTRLQFGAAIGSFQALQHRSVDLFIQQELARHATDAAVQKAEQGATGKALSLPASSAKARAAQAAMLIGTQAIQLHGAIGFTDEYDLGLYMNRTVRLAATLGNAAWHRNRFGYLSEGA
ncbi:alkylation response protein AidB-like acyl-CoA dehydrogenase [Oceanibaculum indicum]|uniref:Alkylation response protein AidB-like acyl-CoA dehydrogenase n=2 Tax=Oceanibaculum indicum TaxID=526216 RepID=A0A420WS99_9PROT|nr:alkylation response protein AidB-like acyl-CoA dehydrogenase [Oceanibaculum indicum]